MPRDFQRTDRLADVLQRELAQLIQRDLKDPRLGMVTISSVEVTRDLAHAKVFVTVYADEEKIKESMKVLKNAAGFLRSQLAKIIKVRTVPELHFIYDSSIVEGLRITSLIDEAIAEDEKKFKK